MSTNNGLTSNQLKIFYICEAFYKNELFLSKTYLKDIDYYGYLIESKIIYNIKKKTNYEKLKPLIAKYESHDIFKKEIKETHDKIEEIIPKNVKEFKKELLNNNKSFYLIKGEYLYYKIIEHDKLKGKEIKFKFHGDKIKIIINENEELNFFNNKDGILSKNIILQINKTINDLIKGDKNIAMNKEKL